MNSKRNWAIVRQSVAVLTFTLALAGTNVAAAASVSTFTSDSPISVASHTMDESVTRTSVSALESSKWRSNSLNIAGSRNWSKLIVFTSTSINVRLPIH